MKTSGFSSPASSRLFSTLFLVLSINDSRARAWSSSKSSSESSSYPKSCIVMFLIWLSVLERKMKSGILNRSQFWISIWVKRYVNKWYNLSAVNKLKRNNHRIVYQDDDIENKQAMLVLDGNSFENFCVEVKDRSERGGIVLREGRRSLTQPLELPLELIGLGGSSMRRIIPGVSSRIVLPPTAAASTSTTTIGWSVINLKTLKRLSQDSKWRGLRLSLQRECAEIPWQKGICSWDEWSETIEGEGIDLWMKTIT